MKIILLCSLLFLTSCVDKKQNISVPELDLKLSEEWMYTEKISNLKYEGVELTRPPGFEQLVMELSIREKGGLNLKKHCVYYLVPYKEKAGYLKVQEKKNIGQCPDTSDDGPDFIVMNDINNLKVSVLNFKMFLDFTYHKEKKKIEIPLPNMELGLVHEKYHSLKELRLMSGMRFLRLDDDSFDFASNRYLGKLADRFSRGTAIRCQQVNKDCETVGESRCEECRYGWYEVVDFQCPQGGSKFCGQNHCGEKNEPACPRGIKVVDIEDAGICQNDLEPVPNLEKILVCQ